MFLYSENCQNMVQLFGLNLAECKIIRSNDKIIYFKRISFFFLELVFFLLVLTSYCRILIQHLMLFLYNRVITVGLSGIL